MKVNPKSVLGQGIINAQPPSGMDEAAKKLKEHEQEVDGEEGINALLMNQVRKDSEKIAHLERERAKLENDRNEALKKLAQAQDQHNYEMRKRRSVRQTIGVTGIHPGVLDLEVETTVMNGRKTQIAWVPVIIWEVPVQNEQRPWFTWKDRRTGEERKRPNLDIGQTRIAESYATVTVLNRAGKEVEVSITGFCTLNLSPKNPREIERRLDRAERKQNWELVSDPDEEPEGAEDEAHLGDLENDPDPEMSFEKPPFIPSEAKGPGEGRTDRAKRSPNNDEDSTA